MGDPQASNKVLKFEQSIKETTPLTRLCGEDSLFHNRYQVERLLGRGGFGVTFLAKDLSKRERPWCVIKQLCPKAKNAKGLERARRCFRREAKILSLLGNHPCIPQMFDYFEEEGEFYLVQEYIEGQTLSREIRQQGRYSEALVKSFLQEILPLLGFVHQQGVIHRDIKPPNIIRRRGNPDGQLVLIDFGAVKELIRQTESDRTITATASTAFVGTFGFSPPEQLALRPTYASDLYALGMTCVYMLTHKMPAEDELPHFRDRQWWRSDDLEVSDQFAQILDKMLEVDLRERYHSVQEVLVDLDPALGTLSDSLAKVPELEELEPHPTYLSPAQRRAQAIRARLERVKQREHRLSQYGPQPW